MASTFFPFFSSIPPLTELTKILFDRNSEGKNFPALGNRKNRYWYAKNYQRTWNANQPHALFGKIIYAPYTFDFVGRFWHPYLCTCGFVFSTASRPSLFHQFRDERRMKMVSKCGLERCQMTRGEVGICILGRRLLAYNWLVNVGIPTCEWQLWPNSSTSFQAFYAWSMVIVYATIPRRLRGARIPLLVLWTRATVSGFRVCGGIEVSRVGIDWFIIWVKRGFRSSRLSVLFKHSYSSWCFCHFTAVKWGRRWK